MISWMPDTIKDRTEETMPNNNSSSTGDDNEDESKWTGLSYLNSSMDGSNGCDGYRHTLEHALPQMIQAAVCVTVNSSSRIVRMDCTYRLAMKRSGG